MTSKSVSSQGTRVDIDTSTSGNTPTWTQINGVTDFSGLGGGSRQVVDVTDLSSPAKEKNVGISDEGQVSYSLIYIPKDPGQKACIAARASGKATKFQITLSDGTVIAYTSYVLTFERGSGVDAVAEVSMNQEITGAIVTTDAP